jgi:phage recombination protein Bet
MTDIVKTEAGLVPARGTRDEARLIRDQLAPKASDAEIRVFLALCQRLDLDPFARQIYLVGRWDSRASREVYAPQVSIDGFRLVAQRTGEYAGQAGPEWCDESGVWRDVWLSQTPPAAARVGVYRRGWAAPLYRVALWSEFQQTKKDGKPSGLWAKMPSVMLAKCAEMQALRAAFPNELSGVYGVEELAQATPVEVVREEPAHTVDVDGLVSALATASGEAFEDLRAEAKSLFRGLSAADKERVSDAVKAAMARLTQPAESASEGSCGDEGGARRGVERTCETGYKGNDSEGGLA